MLINDSRIAHAAAEKLTVCHHKILPLADRWLPQVRGWGGERMDKVLEFFCCLNKLNVFLKKSR